MKKNDYTSRGSFFAKLYLSSTKKLKEILKGDLEIEQDLFDENIDNITEYRSVYDNNKK